MDRRRTDGRSPGQLAAGGPASARLHRGRQQLDHRSQLPGQPTPRHASVAALVQWPYHSGLLHLLRLLRHGRRRPFLRVLLRNGLSPRHGHRRRHHRGLHADRRVPGRVLHRLRAGSHDGDRPGHGARRGCHSARGTVQPDQGHRRGRPSLLGHLGADDDAARRHLGTGLGPGLLRSAAHHRPVHGHPQPPGGCGRRHHRNRLDALRRARCSRHCDRGRGHLPARQEAAGRPGDRLHHAGQAALPPVGRRFHAGSHPRRHHVDDLLSAARDLLSAHRGPVRLLRPHPRGEDQWQPHGALLAHGGLRHRPGRGGHGLEPQ